MTEERHDKLQAPQEELFSLDLATNGGILAPTSIAELRQWINKEIQFWSWLSNTPGGSHRSGIDQHLNPLSTASAQAQEAVQYETSSADAFRQRVANVRQLLERVYKSNAVPHSSSTLGQRIDAMRKRDPMEAQAYLYTRLPETGFQFDSRDFSSWRGFLEGMFERSELTRLPQAEFLAANESLEVLKAKAEQVLGKTAASAGAIHRHYDELAALVETRSSKQESRFEQFMTEQQTAHDEAIDKHRIAMENLEKTFREKMALRAPVEYWDGRKSHHDRRVTITGRWVFGSMAVLAATLCGLAYLALSHLGNDGKPETWRVAFAGLLGVIGVWAVRLLVRMFLSHSHLATDAAERVTMVKTYLALLEGEKLLADDDRKLILQALFRPASDGIVKDEGLPHPALDFLTRIGGKT